MDENNLLRDAFNQDTVAYIADQISRVYPAFGKSAFQEQILADLESLSFGDRAQCIRDGLIRHLPGEYAQAADILIRSLGPEPEGDELEGFEGFYIMPLTMFISSRGLEYPDISLRALYEMTKRFSAEGDIRPFLIRYPEKTLAFLEELIRDPSPYARRLASEGTRPRLPLFSRLPRFQEDPAPVIRLLDQLYRDPNLMVRRSVANNLNDISKDHPETAVEVLRRWRGEQPSPELDWMIRHGLRTLIKQSHPGALALLGYETLGIELWGWQVSSKSLRLGEALDFSWRIRSRAGRQQNLSLNYIIHFRKANGKTRPKVFRLPDKSLRPGETLELRKTHKFPAFKNQRFYSGLHGIELSINGERSFYTEFDLKVPSP